MENTHFLLSLSKLCLFGPKRLPIFSPFSLINSIDSQILSLEKWIPINLNTMGSHQPGFPSPAAPTIPSGVDLSQRAPGQFPLQPGNPDPYPSFPNAPGHPVVGPPANPPGERMFTWFWFKVGNGSFIVLKWVWISYKTVAVEQRLFDLYSTFDTHSTLLDWLSDFTPIDWLTCLFFEWLDWLDCVD